MAIHRNISFLYNSTEEELIQKITSFFSKNGFKLKGTDDRKLIYQNGNLLTNFVTFHVLNLMSTLTIEFDEEKVTVDVNVKTYGQIVTRKDRKKWDDFLNHFMESISEVSEKK